MCGVAIRILHCNGGHIPRTIEQIAALPGAGRKCTALVLTECHDDQTLLTGDTHVCLGATVKKWWPYKKGKGGKLPSFDPDKISQYLEAIISKEGGQRRMLNSAFAGLRQLWNYEGDSSRRQLARTTMEEVARGMGTDTWIWIQELLLAKHSTYFTK